MALTRTSRARGRAAEKPDLDDSLDTTMKALDRLMRLFRIERYLHLVLGGLSFLLLLYVGIGWVRRGHIGDGNVQLMFGSSGLFAAASFRTTYFFGRSFRLVDDLIR